MKDAGFLRVAQFVAEIGIGLMAEFGSFHYTAHSFFVMPTFLVLYHFDFILPSHIVQDLSSNVHRTGICSYGKPSAETQSTRRCWPLRFVLWIHIHRQQIGIWSWALSPFRFIITSLSTLTRFSMNPSVYEGIKKLVHIRTGVQRTAVFVTLIIST